MEANAGESCQMQILFNIFPRISLHCKLVPVQYWEYEYGLIHSRSQSCDPLGQRLGSRALAGSNLTVRDSRTSDRSAQTRIFFKMADQAKSLTRGVESWNGNSRFKRHHIERKEVRGFEAICACNFAVKYFKYTIKFLRWERAEF